MPAGTVVNTLRDRHLLSNRLLLRRLARRVAARAQPLLSPDDGDVLPVALVPRAVWAGQAGNDAIDHGYLAVRGGELLYEGDRWRIRAPRGAVMAAQVEPLVVDRHYTVFFVQAIVRGPDLPFELPFVRIGCPLGELIVRGGKRRSAVLLDRLLPAVTEGSAASGGVELAVSLPPLGSP